MYPSGSDQTKIGVSGLPSAGSGAKAPEQQTMKEPTGPVTVEVEENAEAVPNLHETKRSSTNCPHSGISFSLGWNILQPAMEH